MKNQENELQSLTNAVTSLNLTGHTVHTRFSAHKGRKNTYFLTDDAGNSLTGSWNYDQLNHFILGYGKAFDRKIEVTVTDGVAECDNANVLIIDNDNH